MDAERVRAQLDRILASAAFADAERASSFLRFVVHRALDGRHVEIKESVIAIEAFGRSPSFDSKSDPIVRVEARRLRDRLSAYYAGEGRADQVLISLPKGGYIPEFAEQQRPEQPAAKAKYPAMLIAGWALFGLTALVLVLLYLRKPSQPAGILQLSILPPENTSFDSFAVSPDGRKLAFTAVLNGTIVLWVRQLDSSEAKPLAGTGRASYPFWSPDSRSIGFFAAAKLKTIDMAGGPAREIADAGLGHGGTWSSEGIIVFCPRPLGVLYQVPATGGTARPLTSLDSTRAEVVHGLPQFLPDGRHFLYLAASSRAGESSIRAGSLDSSTSSILLSADTGAEYASVLPGHPPSLLFLSNGALMAQAFDAQAIQLHGGRTVLVPEVRYRRWQQTGFSVSRSGILLYQGGAAEDHRFTWLDRQGKVLKVVGPGNNYAAFTLSPDDDHVAVWRDDDPATELPTIWAMDLARGGAAFRLTDTGVAQAEFLPVWSPRGDELLFSGGDDRRMRLLVQALNGGSARPLLDTDGPKFATDWSSDGRFIAFSSQWPDYRNMHTWTMGLDGASNQPGKPRGFLLHSNEELSASFSPADGARGPRWIAYTSDETGRNEIYVRDFPGGSHKWQVSTDGGWQPHWRRDGRELFYLALDGTLMAVPVNVGATFEPGTPQALFATGLRLTPVQTLLNQYAVARDGQRFLLNRRIPEAAPGVITAVIPR
jgi:eukaryotic-like serine/threonine-protein kinase